MERIQTQFQTTTLCMLDDHVILNLISYLNLFDAKRFLLTIATSKCFENILSQDCMYKNLCFSNYFEHPLIVETKPNNITYRQYFLENMERVRRYTKVFDKLIRMSTQKPDLNYFAQIQKEKPYHTDERKLHSILSSVKKHYGCISKDILMLYRILNGQEELLEADSEVFNQIGLFGFLTYYNYYYIYDFNSFSRPQCGFLENLKAHPFSLVYPLKKNLFIDVTNKLGFGCQTIYSFYPARDSQTSLNLYITHASIDSFMTKLDTLIWEEKQEQLGLIDTLIQPASDTTTNHIRIRATAKHVPMDQNNGLDEFFYTYSVRISANNIPEKKRFKLVKRKWIITSDQAPTHQEIAEGSGVVGYYPEIFLGCDDFLYQSCSIMKGFTGSMRGSFQFKDMDTNEMFDAIINPFSLRPDDDAKLVSFNMNTQQASIIYQTTLQNQHS